MLIVLELNNTSKTQIKQHRCIEKTACRGGQQKCFSNQSRTSATNLQNANRQFNRDLRIRQRGRQSANQLSVIPLTPAYDHVQPPDDATEIETEQFAKVVGSAPRGHFVQADDELILSYVQATLAARRYQKALSDDPKTMRLFAQACRTQGQLAARLRLAPVTRTTAKQTCRRQGAPLLSFYDTMGLNDDD